ncbi:ATP-binding protein [Streptomyces roseicoloratus]|uniref:ATP-binding protein n=1 Tax=Streptomyces roseicoloratus TaxID=2508722 RepID=A0ABY9RTZ5_9ACTN|nr:ATP-binding protein [Streptomyces roseicoloratus]WMX45656.1 ATP-binding protein [Streptomyces roseicoloratus]
MQVLQVQLEVGPDPAEVGRARRWARSRLAGSGIGDDEPLAETLVLLISELVTNAVVHTGCPAVLRMLFGGAGVRVEVADASDCPPRPRHAEGDDTNGRGLELVDGLADRWGWQREGTGKSIWCEVDRAQDAGQGAGPGARTAATGVGPVGGRVAGPVSDRGRVPGCHPLGCPVDGSWRIDHPWVSDSLGEGSRGARPLGERGS